jgi:hypothetical protein
MKLPSVRSLFSEENAQSRWDTKIDEMDSLPSELLASWLAASDEPAKAAVLDAHAPELGAAGASALLELADAGPAYGGDRAREARLQRQLLDLARGLAERAEAWPEAARACHLLGLVAKPGARRPWLERAALHAIAAAEWEMLARIEADLAEDALAAHLPREALAARVRSLAACRRDPASSSLFAAGDRAADALVEAVTRQGDPRTAWGPLQDWLTHTRRGGDLSGIARACERLGTLAGALGQIDDAERWLGEAAAIFGELIEDLALARVLLRRLAIAVGGGDLDLVARRAADLLGLRERTTDPDVQTLIDRAYGDELDF